MIQQIIILLIFGGAVAYLARMLYRSFRKSDCATGCGKCNTIDFNKLEEKLKEKGA